MPAKDKPYIIDGERVTLEEYRKTKYEDIRLRVPIGKKDMIQAHAARREESLNGFVNRAIDNQVERDNRNESAQIKSAPDMFFQLNPEEKAHIEKRRLMLGKLMGNGDNAKGAE